jgi:hypothetical protein
MSRELCPGHWEMCSEALQRDIVDAADKETRDALVLVAVKRIRAVERRRFRRDRA